MRAVPSLRLLVPATALLAAACDDSPNPIAPEEPLVAEAEAPAPAPATGPQEDLAYWADGYLAVAEVNGKILQTSNTSFNRSGGAIVVTKVAGTTGRYIARLRNLSALLGGKSTVHVSSAGEKHGATYCKPVGGFLVRDSVEVRCFGIGTGAAANSDFSLVVLGKRDDRAFAFASQPTATNYAPASAGSWNPAGTTRVYHDGVGAYRVVFTGLAARLPAGSRGHVQVNAVSTNKVHCMVEYWRVTTDLEVTVACYNPNGARVDSKFTTLFTPPAAHLAYIWADQPSVSYYNPLAEYRSNPVGGAVTVTRLAVGKYEVRWIGVDAEIRNFGNVQVTAWGYNNAHCRAATFTGESVTVRCHGANGAPIDTHYVVLLGS